MCVSAKGTDAGLRGPERPQPLGTAEGKLRGAWAPHGEQGRHEGLSCLWDPSDPEPSAVPALELIACREILPLDTDCSAAAALLAEKPRS